MTGDPEILWHFLDRFTVGDECWEWNGATAGAGYAMFRKKGLVSYAYRFSYELFVGPIPEGLQIDHLCKNRRCVRFDHLEPVTQAENIRRQFAERSQAPCPNGHPYNETNFARTGSTRWRRCRVCDRDNHRHRWEQRKKESA